MINSDFFGTSYLHLKNTYVIPLVNTKIDYSHVEYWLIKELLKSNKVVFNYLSQNTFTITLEKSDFYKSLIAEIFCFQTKAVHQLKEFEAKHTSSNWKFVTMYYYSFFSTFEFLLFLHKGFMYLDEDLKKYIDSILSLTSSVPISLSVGNYFFYEKELLTNDKVVVKFSKSNGKGTHEDTWNKFSELTKNELLQHADRNEEAVIKQLNKIFSVYKSTFPSITRNFFNYNPKSAFNDIKPQIYYVNNIDEKFLQKFLSLTISKEDSNEHKAYVCHFCSILISSLKEKLYNEYVLRNKDNELIKMNKKISDFVIG